MNSWFGLKQSMYLGYKDFRIFWSAKSWLFGWGLRTFCACLGFVLLAHAADRADAIPRLLVSYALFAGCAATLWVVAASTWIRSEGMLAPLMAAPSGLFACTLGRGLVWAANGFVTSAGVFFISIWYFGLGFDLAWILRCLVAFAVASLSTYAFGIFWGLIGLFVPALRNIMASLLGTAIFAFGGVVVPIDFWSPWVGKVALALPSAHLAPLLQQGATQSVLGPVTAELAVGTGWLMLALLAAHQAAAWARRSGNVQE